MSAEVGFVDLVDFFDRWPEKREKVMALVHARIQDPELAAILRTMVFVLDRVGPAEIDP